MFNNNKLKKRLIIIIAVLILLPIIIDRIFAHECYMLWCNVMKVKSPMSDGEWFGFLGSYLGVFGTVIIGIIAYWQTDIINNQSVSLNNLQKQMAELQKEITDFQIHPIIYIKETSLLVEDGTNGLLSAEKALEDYYFTIYGKEQIDVGYQYVLIEITFEDRGIIPTVQCKISGLKWEIANNSYHIELNESKQEINTYDKVYVLIDRKDFLINGDLFFRDLDLHKHFNNSGKLGYGTSIMELKLNFVNQKGYQQVYNLTYRIKSEQGVLSPSLYFRSEEEVKNERR